MKRLLHLGAGACAFLLALSVVVVGGGPTTVSFQGRLTDEDGEPVKDSTYTVATGLWGQIVGGSNLNDAEIHVVPTKDGVFTIELNESGTFFTNCAPCDAYLQIEVMGPGGFTPLSPRIHLAATAHALTSATFHSEASSGATLARGTVRVINSPGMPLGHELELSTDADGDGVSEFAALDSATTEGVRRVALADADGDGTAEHSVQTHVNGDRALLGLKNYDVLRAYTAGDDITLQTDDSSSSIELRRQSSPDEVSIHVVDDEAAMSMKKYMPGNPYYGNLKLTATDTGSVLDLTHVGADGESGMRAKNIRKNISVTLFKSDKTHAARLAVDSGLSELVLEADTDGDGFSEGSSQLQTSPAGVSHRMVWNSAADLGVHPDFSLQVNINPQEVGDMATSDEDRDGVADHTRWGKVDNTQSITAVETDADEDSIPETGVHASSNASRSSLRAFFETGAGIKTYVESAVTNATANMSAQAQSTSGGGGFACNAGYHRCDLIVSHSGPDGLGGLEVLEEVTLETREDTASLSIGRLESGPGNHRDGWNVLAAQDKNELTCVSEAGLLPGEPVIGTITMGTTSNSNRLIIGNAQGGGVIGLVCKRDLLTGLTEAVLEVGAEERRVVVQSSDASCGLVMVDATGGTDDTAIVLDAVTKRFGIGVSEPVHPIEHSSGAHLTLGGVWTNASDKASKENFQPVDGRKLLEQIDRLPISRWNYRNEADDIQHIGPTAQDFKNLFDVGSNDRSISTVDPSGIALAAIKELHKENHELRQQNLELLSRLEELDRKLDRVLSK